MTPPTVRTFHLTDQTSQVGGRLPAPRPLSKADAETQRRQLSERREAGNQSRAIKLTDVQKVQGKFKHGENVSHRSLMN